MFRLVRVKRNDWKQSTAAGILSAVNAWMPGDLESFLKQTAEKNRLDVIISVSSYDSGTGLPLIKIGHLSIVIHSYYLAGSFSFDAFYIPVYYFFHWQYLRRYRQNSFHQ